MRGHLQSAVNYITDREGGGILYPNDVDEKSGHTVSRVLQDKHPSISEPGPAAMPAYESVPELPTLEITTETVEIVAGKLLPVEAGYRCACYRACYKWHDRATDL